MDIQKQQRSMVAQVAQAMILMLILGAYLAI